MVQKAHHTESVSSPQRVITCSGELWQDITGKRLAITVKSLAAAPHTAIGGKALIQNALRQCVNLSVAGEEDLYIIIRFSLFTRGSGLGSKKDKYYSKF